MKTMLLKTWDHDTLVGQELIEVEDDYDVTLSPYDLKNQIAAHRCIGSNQQIVEVE